MRNADLLQTYLEGAGLDVQRFDSRPGRTSIVARIEGSDPDAPTLCLMGHTDVVPVNPDGWSRDPFGGELVDGEVWGRGAIDMLNITSSMAVAFRQLASEGFRPKGTLIYFGVADEEAGGHWGAEYMIDDHWDAVGADYVLTESRRLVDDRPRRHPPRHGEHRREGHRVAPAAGARHARPRLDAVRRRQRPDHRRRGRAPAGDVPHHAPTSTTCGRRGSATMDLPDDLRAALADPARIHDALASLPPNYARLAHACTHTTISPNVIHGGQKTNTIPDVIDIDVDMRTVPGDTREVVDGYLAEALGELAERVEVSPLQECDATRSPTDNPLWDALRTRTQVAYPGAELAPGIITGGTDARFYRDKGSIAYGAGAVLTRGDDGVLRPALPRQRRAHRRRVARPVRRLLVRRRQARGRLTTGSEVSRRRS